MRPPSLSSTHTHVASSQSGQIPHECLHQASRASGDVKVQTRLIHSSTALGASHSYPQNKQVAMPPLPKRVVCKQNGQVTYATSRRPISGSISASRTATNASNSPRRERRSATSISPSPPPEKASKSFKKSRAKEYVF